MLENEFSVCCKEEKLGQTCLWLHIILSSIHYFSFKSEQADSLSSKFSRVHKAFLFLDDKSRWNKAQQVSAGGSTSGQLHCGTGTEINKGATADTAKKSSMKQMKDAKNKSSAFSWRILSPLFCNSQIGTGSELVILNRILLFSSKITHSQMRKWFQVGLNTWFKLVFVTLKRQPAFHCQLKPTKRTRPEFVLKGESKKLWRKDRGRKQGQTRRCGRAITVGQYAEEERSEKSTDKNKENEAALFVPQTW